MAPSAVYALDWSLKASDIETIELNDNQFLRTSPAASLGSYSTITTNAEARTPVSKFDFDADGSYKKYWGPGADGAQSESISYGFRGRYQLDGKTASDNEYLESAWRQTSTAFALLGDLGVVTSTRGFLDSLSFRGGMNRSISALDSLSLFATSTHISYEPSSGGTPLTDTLANGLWRHRVSSITELQASSEFELLNYENALNTSVQIYRNKLGFNSTLSSVLSMNGNIGAAYLITEGGANPLASLGSNPANTSASSALLDWIGDAVLTYKILKNTTLSLVASQSIGPSIVGSLSKRDSITANLSQTINPQSTLSFSANVSRSIATVSTDYASASIGYGYSFTRDWTAHLTYRFLHRFASTGGTTTIDSITGTPTVGGTGPASSNSVMLVISHSYTVLPAGGS